MDAELERTFTFFRFEELRVYHKALDYSTWVIRHTQSFYDKEHGLLSKRFNSSAQKIALNIAEGSALYRSQFINHLKIAKSMVRDCLVYTSIARQLNYLSKEDEEYSRNQLMELTKMIGALIGSLQKAERFDEEDG